MILAPSSELKFEAYPLGSLPLTLSPELGVSAPVPTAFGLDGGNQLMPIFPETYGL